MINIHSLDGNDHFIGHIMMAMFVFSSTTQMRRFIEVAPKANYHSPSFKYKHQPKCNVLFFLFLSLAT